MNVELLPPKPQSLRTQMTQKNNLDLKGIISAYPIAEVILEIAQAGLTGSLRTQQKDAKAVIYFRDGGTIYAVSNERKFRLVEMLAMEGNFAIDSLRGKQIANDLELVDAIVESGTLSKTEVERTVASQGEMIIRSLLNWCDGEWTFSPHARLKAGIEFPIDTGRILIDYARQVGEDFAAKRIQNPNEWFELLNADRDARNLNQQEAFILSRFDSEAMTVDKLASSGCADCPEVLSTIYSLWLGGFLKRCGWKAAFTDERVKYLNSATLELKRQKSAPIVSKLPQPVEPVDQSPAEDNTPFDLEACLARIESAGDYYTVLGIQPSAKVAEVRKAYFKLAKMLHPDRYHHEAPDFLKRIENAFTELAQAHETLKSPDARQGYDIKLRQAERDNEAGETKEAGGSRKEEQAASDFERGLALQLEGAFEAAIPFLARAVYYAPENARYHAQFGKTLAFDQSQRHKAQAELLTAVQLDPGNTSFRLMLAEFFVRYKLLKRAEGELNRLLEMSPGNKEAIRMLDSLQRN